MILNSYLIAMNYSQLLESYGLYGYECNIKYNYDHQQGEYWLF